MILREFAMGYDSPERMLNKLIWGTAFRVHPYRVPVIGYEDIFRTMTRDQLETYFHRHYVPDNMITVVVGDINAAEVLACLRETFARFTRRPRAPPSPSPPSRRWHPRGARDRHLRGDAARADLAHRAAEPPGPRRCSALLAAIVARAAVRAWSDA